MPVAYFFFGLGWVLMLANVAFYVYAWRTRSRIRGHDLLHAPRSPGGGTMFTGRPRPSACVEDYVPARLLESERRKTRRSRL